MKEKEENKGHDDVKNPAHYEHASGVELKHIIGHLPGFLFSACKYIQRGGRKGDETKWKQDFAKARESFEIWREAGACLLALGGDGRAVAEFLWWADEREDLRAADRFVRMTLGLVKGALNGESGTSSDKWFDTLAELIDRAEAEVFNHASSDMQSACVYDPENKV